MLSKAASAFSRAKSPQTPSSRSRHPCAHTPNRAPGRPSLQFSGAKSGVETPPGGRCLRRKGLQDASPERGERERSGPLRRVMGSVGVRSALGATSQRVGEPGGGPGPALPGAARGDSAAFAALHCPLVSGAETAPGGGGRWFCLLSCPDPPCFPGHEPCLSRPQGLQKAPCHAQRLPSPPPAPISPKRTQDTGRLSQVSSVTPAPS